MKAYKLFTMVLAFNLSTHAQQVCEKVHLDRKDFIQTQIERTFDFNDKISFIREEQRSANVGRMNNFFSKRFGTRIYHNQVAVPNSFGKQPAVSPTAKALVIFFHGSGTMKSSGSNFTNMMNELASMNISALSFDMPFHAEGPRKEEFNDARYFTNWVKDIIESHRVAGQPVYLVGHSFGPDVIAEVLARNPRLVDGSLLLSPAGFDKITEDWYDQHTSKMKFGEDVAGNDAGGEWAYKMSKQFIWRNGKNDPTKINKNLKIKVVTGDHEEYIPAPVGGPNGTPVGPNTYDVGVAFKKFYSRFDILFLKNIGHYIFDMVDANKNNVILREVLLLTGAEFKTVSELRIARESTQANEVGYRWATDILFRSWALKNVGQAQILAIYNKKIDDQGKAVLDAYVEALSNIRFDIMKDIVKYSETNPEFAEKYKSNLENLKKAKKPDASLNAVYLKYLEADAAKMSASPASIAN